MFENGEIQGWKPTNDKGGVFPVSDTSDAGIVAFFEDHWKESNVEFDKEGKPSGKSCVYIRIIFDGGFSENFREATEADKKRFPAQWENYKKGQSRAVIGTPLEVLPFLNTAHVKMLKYHDIYSGEQLCALTDSACGKLGILGWQLRKDANAFFDNTKNTAASVGLVRKIDSLEREISFLKEKSSATTLLKDDPNLRSKITDELEHEIKLGRSERDELRSEIAALRTMIAKLGGGGPIAGTQTESGLLVATASDGLGAASTLAGIDRSKVSFAPNIKLEAASIKKKSKKKKKKSLSVKKASPQQVVVEEAEPEDFGDEVN